MLGGGKGKEPVWGISCLSKVSQKARVPFKGAIPGAPRGVRAALLSPLTLHQQEILHPEACLWLICAFEVWVHPQHVSQRHIKQVATPADQVRPPLSERSKLGNQSQFMQGNLACLSYSSSQRNPFLFQDILKIKKKKKTNTTLANLHT